MFLTSPLIEQALAQACAVCSPGAGSMRVIDASTKKQGGCSLWFSCHQPNDIHLAATFPVRLLPHDLIMFDHEKVKQMKHCVAIGEVVRPAFHHNKSAGLK